jgi:hypothetical protein
MMKKYTAFLALVWIGTSALAAPMGFQGSTMVMGDFSRDWQDMSSNYALTPKDAVGLETLSMRSSDTLRRRSAQLVTYTRLAKRWNMPHAQANVWLFGAAGTLGGSQADTPFGSRSLFSPGLQVDYETTRLYLAGTYKAYRASQVNHDYASVRAGFSFFEADYDETQPWLIVEARRMRDLSDKTEITPMLRLIHNRYFLELGSTLGSAQERQARVNLMINF